MKYQESLSNYPVHFTITEVVGKAGQYLVYVGNTGGKYVFWPEWNHIGQHFTPDNHIDTPEDLKLQRKFATLYPAVLWCFLDWHASLPDTDPKSQLNCIKGSTTPAMSHMRAKLLGDVYTSTYIPADQSITTEAYETYTIDLNMLRSSQSLLRRLQRFHAHAKAQGYCTTYDPLNNITPPAKIIRHALVGA